VEWDNTSTGTRYLGTFTLIQLTKAQIIRKDHHMMTVDANAKLTRL